ncbi:MAG TPA: phosphotransferase [Ktedonobacteraceae bacterium]|jgi:hypothetical protein
MDQQRSGTSHLSIQELPLVVQDLFTLAHQELLPEARRPPQLFVRYLRRKAGRGLAVMYDACEALPRRQRAAAAHRAISLTLDEQALTGSAIRVSPAQARNAVIEQSAAGLIQARDLGMALAAFPADGGLPTLAECCDTSAGAQLLPALQEAAGLLLADGHWQIQTAQAMPIRYKPGSRCVIRYDLLLAHEREPSATRALSLFGKVYADPTQARRVQEVMQLLYAEQLASTGLKQATPFLPRPLLLAAGPRLGLCAAVRPLRADGVLRTGTSVLVPRVLRQAGGNSISPELPADELRLAALALARLHTSQIRPGELAVRTGTKEAQRARERAGLLAGYYPAQAADIQDLVQVLARHLETLRPPVYRPAHGGFKASQLLYHDGTVSVVDFDGFCLADPALDVGYFLAYLRPGGLWYGRQSMRAWFEAAGDLFLTTYVRALQEPGLSPQETTGIVQRAPLYAAALLFKIATRRVNRLNSPRTQELAGMLNEIASCLALTRRME